jgi:hypothetical protein
MKLTRRSMVATALASPLILRSARAADLRARIAFPAHSFTQLKVQLS